MNDFEQCSNQLQLDLISLLVNFSYELSKMMTRYVFLDAGYIYFKTKMCNSATYKIYVFVHVTNNY